MQKPKIVHIEDSKGWRDILGEMFKNGFDPNKTEFESREDCEQLKKEIAGEAPLAQVYILDNEIGWDYGGKLASEIYDAAKQRGENVIVISLLCSSLDSVQKEFGVSLKERNIPVLDKLEHAPLIGFYVAHCLEKEKLTFPEYIEKTGIKLIQSAEYTDRTSIQDGMLRAIADGKPGLFYQTPQEFIGTERQSITRYMKPKSIALMDRIYPIIPGRLER